MSIFDLENSKELEKPRARLGPKKFEFLFNLVPVYGLLLFSLVKNLFWISRSAALSALSFSTKSTIEEPDLFSLFRSSLEISYTLELSFFSLSLSFSK